MKVKIEIMIYALSPLVGIGFAVIGYFEKED